MWIFNGISLYNAFAVLISAAAAFILASFLRARYQEKTVVTTMLWREVLEVAKPESFFKRLSALLSLILMLILAILACTAMLEPVWKSNKEASRTVYIIDCQSLKQIKTSGGKTMIDAALKIIQNSNGTKAVIVAGTSPVIAKDFDKAIDEALFKESLPASRSNIDSAVKLAKAMLENRSNSQDRIVIFTDRGYYGNNIKAYLPATPAPYFKLEFARNLPNDKALIVKSQNGLSGQKISFAQKDIKVQKNISNSEVNAYTLDFIPNTIYRDNKSQVKIDYNDNLSKLMYTASGEIPKEFSDLLNILPGLEMTKDLNKTSLSIIFTKKFPDVQQAEFLRWNSQIFAQKLNDKLWILQDFFDKNKELTLQPDFISFFAENIYKTAEAKITKINPQYDFMPHNVTKIFNNNKNAANATFEFMPILLLLAVAAAIIDVFLFAGKRIP